MSTFLGAYFQQFCAALKAVSDLSQVKWSEFRPFKWLLNHALSATLVMLALLPAAWLVYQNHQLKLRVQFHRAATNVIYGFERLQEAQKADRLKLIPQRNEALNEASGYANTACCQLADDHLLELGGIERCQVLNHRGTAYLCRATAIFMNRLHCDVEKCSGLDLARTAVTSYDECLKAIEAERHAIVSDQQGAGHSLRNLRKCAEWHRGQALCLVAMLQASVDRTSLRLANDELDRLAALYNANDPLAHDVIFSAYDRWRKDLAKRANSHLNATNSATAKHILGFDPGAGGGDGKEHAIGVTSSSGQLPGA